MPSPNGLPTLLPVGPQGVSVYDKAENDQLKILIADDSDSDRLILKAMVRRQGHEVIEARDGVEAVEHYRKHRPDLVLLDVMMPRMDGMQAAAKIKQLAGEVMVPLIFLTSLSDADALARCLEAGGDDFLSKPYNRVIIEAKIKAFNRMRLMHDTLSRQRDHIQASNQQLLQEQEVARQVFDNVAHAGCLDAPTIRYQVSPMSIFNGDILFASPKPSGGMHVLVGDFTGHGLPAAIGAMPVAEVFYGMTAKGFSGSDILREINHKLKRILPTGMFCCAMLVDADFHRRILRVWNGGLPDAHLIRRTGEREVIPSSHLPLGVLAADRFNGDTLYFRTQEGDTLVMMTDGVLEAVGQDGDMFGEQRLAAALDQADGTAPFERVMTRLRGFMENQAFDDDLTLVTLDMVKEAPLVPLPTQPNRFAATGPQDWNCHYAVQGRTLATFNPVPLMLHICDELPGLRRRSGEVYTILAELYTNALEHGILGLPSEWKDSPDGFARYYREREHRLAGDLEGHQIRFELCHQKTEDGGRLLICCEDSGGGFDHEAISQSQMGNEGYAGRGLSLIRQLCGSVCYSEGGKRAEVVYHWRMS
ncbi:MAG: SpoIIE family protein phosphatase [Marinobacter sp.]|nr:SpoIIE family protein phosphatase [Marinobacter sp.]